ncbi:sce7726 family protein [Lysinibacillus sp. FSL L8-0312]|uniref:sce7726 family protein n=1 Tax=unclassified Lysinibacillus TaxID=2636778 RepID=UPI00232F7B0E|nr:sce7726 family protein [Lysinibacillus sp. OF-1]WCH48208.1 sce7726 family protein [Lysinibacillus sp. OF-1]
MMKVDEKEMRNALINRLNGYKECYIYEEFTVPSGKARADVVAVNGHVIAYEIKSDYDSLKRLETQILEYDLNFEMNYIVTGKKLLQEAEQIIPNYWGIILIEKNSNGKLKISFERRAKLNPYLSFENFVALLTAEEVKKVAIGQPAVTNKYSKLQIRKFFKQDLVKLLNEHLSLNKKREIKHLIRLTLKSKTNEIAN